MSSMMAGSFRSNALSSRSVGTILVFSKSMTDQAVVWSALLLFGRKCKNEVYKQYLEIYKVIEMCRSFEGQHGILIYIA